MLKSKQYQLSDEGGKAMQTIEQVENEPIEARMAALRSLWRAQNRLLRAMEQVMEEDRAEALDFLRDAVGL